MRLRRRHALLLLIAVLWAFGAYHGARDARAHFQDRATAVDLAGPARPVIAALQEERRLTVRALAGANGTGGPAGAGDPNGKGGRDALVAARTRTDRAVADLRRGAGRLRARWSGAPGAAGAPQLFDRLDALAAVRDGADTGALDRRRAAAGYDDAVDAALRLCAAPWPRTDPAAAGRQRALAGLDRAGELLAREDTLVSGAPAGLTDAERAELGRLGAARRWLRERAVADLAAPDRARLDGTPDPGQRGLAAAEESPGTGPAAGWRATVDAALAADRAVTEAGVRDGARAAVPAGVSAVVLAGLFAGLGLVAMFGVAAVARRRDEAVAAAGPDDGTAAALLRLSRRNQALLHRQLAVLDQLERREGGPADLAALFHADHLATRLRRNVEKAIILGGHEPGRRWRRPVPVIDVVRAAAAAVERYAAVMVTSVDTAALAGPAVGDVTRLLTELVDNATRYSPAGSTVWVTGELGLTAYTVVVQDRGPGMAPHELAAARDLLARPFRPLPPGDPGDPARTGLRVAGRLARAQDIEIELEPAPRGGIVARVRLPLALLVPEAHTTAETAGEPPFDEPPPGQAPPGQAPPGQAPPGEPPAGGLPVRSPRPVPAPAAGSGRGHPDRPAADRTARFRARLTARGPGDPAATVELPAQPSTNAES